MRLVLTSLILPIPCTVRTFFIENKALVACGARTVTLLEDSELL